MSVRCFQFSLSCLQALRRPASLSCVFCIFAQFFISSRRLPVGPWLPGGPVTVLGSILWRLLYNPSQAIPFSLFCCLLFDFDFFKISFPTDLTLLILLPHSLRCGVTGVHHLRSDSQMAVVPVVVSVGYFSIKVGGSCGLYVKCPSQAPVGGLGIQTQVFMLCQQAFTNWAISPAFNVLLLLFFKTKSNAMQGQTKHK